MKNLYLEELSANYNPNGTDLQKTNGIISEYLFLIRASSLHDLAPFAKEKNATKASGGGFIGFECDPTQTAIEKLEGIAHEYLYGEKQLELDGLPAIEKGIAKEDEALEELSKIIGEKVVKNTVRISNWQLGLTGVIDSDMKRFKTIYDIKNAQFPDSFRKMKRTGIYDLQLVAYIMLWNAMEARKGNENAYDTAKLAMFLLDNDINDFAHAVDYFSRKIDRYKIKSVEMHLGNIIEIACETTNKYCYSLDKKIACYNRLADWCDSYLNLNILEPMPNFRGVPMELRYFTKEVNVSELNKAKIKAIVDNCHKWLEINNPFLFNELKSKKNENLF